MRDDRFEWSDAKARANLIDHKVSFDVAKLAFDDPRSLEEIDDRFDYGEDRFNVIGMDKGELLTVTYTQRGDRVRIISARKATRREQINYIRQESWISNPRFAECRRAASERYRRRDGLGSVQGADR
jgi:uncharacterized DUF497 family protein